MNEQPETPGWQPAAVEPEQAVAPAETEQAVTEAPFAAEPLPDSPTVQEPVVESGSGAAAGGGGRPEVVVAAAFAGGLLLARILKRFAD